MLEVEIRTLNPLDLPAHRARRPNLEQLTDDELLESVRRPVNGDVLVINSRTGLLHDGNGRAIELLRRADNPDSTITRESKVPVEFYTPDVSMFPDLD